MRKSIKALGVPPVRRKPRYVIVMQANIMNGRIVGKPRPSYADAKALVKKLNRRFNRYHAKAAKMKSPFYAIRATNAP